MVHFSVEIYNRPCDIRSSPIAIILVVRMKNNPTSILQPMGRCEIKFC